MYRIVLTKTAEKSLRGLQNREQSAILSRIEKLAENAHPPDSKKLKGRNAWRIRSGQYRIIYEVEKRILRVMVVAIGHRRDVYRES